MSKFPTFPILYDELKTVSISFLNKHGYLKPNQWQRGTINWSRNGTKTGSISIQVSTEIDNGNLLFDYKCNDVPTKYNVQLITTPSNLGKGKVWFFVCPHTGKRCKKLYLRGGYFYHRSAFIGGMYDCQIQSKKYRQLGKTWGAYFKIDQLYEQIYKKHFKKHYAGKPTKRYTNLISRIQQFERIPLRTFEKPLSIK